MKVLWLAPIKYPSIHGGHPAPWIEELAKNLSKKIDLTILNVSPLCKNNIEIFRENNITKIFLKIIPYKIDILMFYLNKIITIKKWLRNNIDQFDLIHIHGNEHQFEVATKYFSKPQILSIQGIISEILKYYNPSGLQRLGWIIKSIYEKRHYKYINNYICRTGWDENIVKRYNANARIFNNWEIIREEFFNDVVQKRGDNILYLGGANELKGIYYALKSFEMVKEKINGKLLIGGNITEAYLKNYITRKKIKLNIKNDLEILGFLEPEEIIKNAKRSFCLLHPTLIDNSPNSVCEAQIIGLPVIASNVGGVPALIKDKVTGILSNINESSFAQNMLQLNEDYRLWDTLSKNSKEVSRRRHNTQRIIEATLNIYKKIM